MAQAKKKTSTKTKKKTTARKTGSRANTRTNKCKGISNKERMHIYIVTVMSMIAVILLCADVAMMIVQTVNKKKAGNLPAEAPRGAFLNDFK